MELPGLERCFSMAAFLAFIELRDYLKTNPTLCYREALRSLRSLRSGAIGLDFSAAMTLLNSFDPDLPYDQTRNGLRIFVYEWVRLAQPAWLRSVPMGREYVRAALTGNEVQCFREAGLFDESPDDDAITWWDKTAALMRGTVDAEKMDRARLAERLSIAHERKRLSELGIEREPKWMALEDNSLGFDILSYDLDAGRIVNRMIEVKSTLSDRIILTRGEWKNAASAASRTVFHIWRFPSRKLQEVPTTSMERHIPRDRGDGCWQDVVVTLPAYERWYDPTVGSFALVQKKPSG